MPRTYKYNGAVEQCEECGAELEAIVYKGLKLACPECVPSGLFEKYKLGGDEEAYLEAYAAGEL
jgi:uncharacterized protein (DUF983 family)